MRLDDEVAVFHVRLEEQLGALARYVRVPAVVAPEGDEARAVAEREQLPAAADFGEQAGLFVEAQFECPGLRDQHAAFLARPDCSGPGPRPAPRGSPRALQAPRPSPEFAARGVFRGEVKRVGTPPRRREVEL